MTKRRLTWSNDDQRADGGVDADNSGEAGLFKRPRKRNFETIRKRIVKLAGAGRFSDLEDYLTPLKLTEEEIVQFYRECGAQMIRSTFTLKTTNLLSFLARDIPPSLGYELLSSDNFNLLTRFSKSRLFYKRDPSLPGRWDVCVDRLVFLMKISRQAVEEFVTAHGEQDYFVQGIKPEYEEALVRCAPVEEGVPQP